MKAPTEMIRGRMAPALAGLVAVLAVLLWLSPAERTLGQTVKLVYLHGALVRTAVLIFAVSLPVNIVALIQGSGRWTTWGKALIWAATLIWLLHTLFSMVTTYAAWGLFIAWYEPRTRFTFILAGVAVIVAAAAYMVENDRFSALVFILLAGLTLGFMPRLGFIQHPLDPIGVSSSLAIRLYYTGILIVTVIMGALLTFWLREQIVTKGV